MATVDPPGKRSQGNGLADAALEALAQTLADQLGRVPTGAELIEAAGGCQKQRALRAIQAVRARRAEREVAGMLVLPPAFDTELRGLMGRWLGLAAQQLADRHAQHQSQTEAQMEAAASGARDVETENESLRVQVLDLQKVQRELISRTHSLQSRLESAVRERDTSAAVAAERQRVLDAWMDQQKPGAS